VNRRAILCPSRAGRRRVPQPPRQTACRRALIDRAQLLTLTAPEMTVLVGGLRVLGANAGKSTRRHQAARDADGRLLRQLLDMRTQWRPSAGSEGVAGGATEDERGQVDQHGRLIFGSHSRLRPTEVCVRGLEGEVCARPLRRGPR
jgi:catalase-peroxidase